MADDVKFTIFQYHKNPLYGLNIQQPSFRGSGITLDNQRLFRNDTVFQWKVSA